MKNYYISWWNQENLFDVEDSVQRSDCFQRRLTSEQKGWNAGVLDNKLNQLASVIRKMNSNTGPDILCVCEAENKNVLEKLVEKLLPLNRNYGIAHHDMSGNRGIEIAFFYDKELFEFEGQFSYEVLKRRAARGLFQVNLRTEAGNPRIVTVNRWPACSGGMHESEPCRMMAGESLSCWLERIINVLGNNFPLVIDPCPDPVWLGGSSSSVFNSGTDYSDHYPVSI